MEQLGPNYGAQLWASSKGRAPAPVANKVRTGPDGLDTWGAGRARNARLGLGLAATLQPSQPRGRHDTSPPWWPVSGQSSPHLHPCTLNCSCSCHHPPAHRHGGARRNARLGATPAATPQPGHLPLPCLMPTPVRTQHAPPPLSSPCSLSSLPHPATHRHLPQRGCPLPTCPPSCPPLVPLQH